MESMFSTPRHEADELLDESPSAWPAVVAAIFAWFVALLRIVIGQARQESLDLDIVLAVGATLLIPSIVLSFWLHARRSRRTQRRRPVELTLVSSSPRRRVAIVHMHKENTRHSA
jgi:prolipoprotein diacylglyceryltransferase